MDSQPIFLINGDGHVVLNPQPYDTEDVLQRLLAEHPDVLAGRTTEGGEPEKLLLVKREMGVRTTDGGTSTYSLDHLFVDGHGVPVIVEVKRSTDTRIRREVVGQMLDYAANGTQYWPVTQLRADLAEVDSGDADADAVVRSQLGVEDVEQFWKTVEDNLRSGRVRLIFVADALPEGLVRVIEFMNEQMSRAEVLGVEVPQYVGEGGVRVLVPRVVGATQAAVEIKRPGGGAIWSRDSFLDVAADRNGPEVVALFDRLFDDVQLCGGRLSWGRSVNPGVSGWYPVRGEVRPVWTASTGVAGLDNHPYLYFWFLDLYRRIPDRLDVAFPHLERITGYRDGLAVARSVGFEGSGSTPSVLLDAVARSKSELDALFSGIEALTDRSE